MPEEVMQSFTTSFIFWLFLGLSMVALSKVPVIAKREAAYLVTIALFGWCGFMFHQHFNISGSRACFSPYSAEYNVNSWFVSPLVGKTNLEILSLLGSPKHISDKIPGGAARTWCYSKGNLSWEIGIVLSGEKCIAVIPGNDLNRIQFRNKFQKRTKIDT